MITRWGYHNRHEFISEVKQTILEQEYNAVDVGASIYHWSYPECKTVIDGMLISGPDINCTVANLDNEQDLERIEKQVLEKGKYDYSICSHTLEDVFSPLRLITFLTRISKRGYIAMPSKYDEFKIHTQGFIRGYAHHKTIFDIKNDRLVLIPKYTFIEKDPRSDEVAQASAASDLVFFWEETIPVSIFGSEVIYTSDESLSSAFYNTLLT
jgi:hypothetical protein